MKIAIVKLSALGDIIHSAFILQFIKQKIPNAQIDWIIEEGFTSILEHNPHIDNIKTVKLKSIKNNFVNIFKEIQKIKNHAKADYDIVIDLQGLTKSAITAKLLSSNVAGFDKASIREGFAALFYNKKIHIPYHENTIDRYRVLAAQALDITIKKEDIMQKTPYLFYTSQDLEQVNGFLVKDRVNVVFVVGSTWQSRIYPKEKLVTIANALDEANILIPFGNQSEYEDAKFIEANCTNVIVLPKISLNALKALISNVDFLIGNDTGPSYIAWANNIPSITLFGPTPPTRIYETNINKVLKSNSHVDPYKLDKNDFSINEIQEEEIIKIAQKFLHV